eukprot:TRINITY_DN671_c0_g1_i5.p1 TRINITY_DN671_c0_g1~~TRINITY_DN671_c0_g1_i5.p1  ORF type:complete len:224 (-),score=49.96 TRINITY_DN671_c0_g1_i5:90-761(-)
MLARVQLASLALGVGAVRTSNMKERSPVDEVVSKCVNFAAKKIIEDISDWDEEFNTMEKFCNMKNEKGKGLFSLVSDSMTYVCDELSSEPEHWPPSLRQAWQEDEDGFMAKLNNGLEEKLCPKTSATEESRDDGGELTLEALVTKCVNYAVPKILKEVPTFKADYNTKEKLCKNAKDDLLKLVGKHVEYSQVDNAERFPMVLLVTVLVHVVATWKLLGRGPAG